MDVVYNVAALPLNSNTHTNCNVYILLRCMSKFAANEVNCYNE